MKNKRLLGIDLGGMNVKYGLYDGEGNPLDEGGVVDTGRYDLDALLDKFDEIVRKYDNLDGLGMSVPGCIDKKTGILYEGGAIRILDKVDLRGILARKYDFPVTMENDANCATLAEKWLGNGKDSDTFLCMTIGTGIGGGLFLDGKLYTGHRNFAGEYGFMRIPARDDYNLSFSETSTWMLLAHIKEKGFSLTGKEFFERLDSGEEVLEDIYWDWIDRLTMGIFNLAVVIDPEKILIGGGISAQPRIYTDIRASMEKLIDVAFYFSTVEIMPCHFRNDAGKIGAIYKLITQGVL